MLLSILTIAGGLIASSSLIELKNPSTRPWFEKVAPFQGGLGVALLASLIGVWASFFIDSAPAPTIVLLMTLIFIAVFAGASVRARRAARTSPTARSRRSRRGPWRTRSTRSCRPRSSAPWPSSS